MDVFVWCGNWSSLLDAKSGMDWDRSGKCVLITVAVLFVMFPNYVLDRKCWCEPNSNLLTYLLLMVSRPLEHLFCPFMMLAWWEINLKKIFVSAQQNRPAHLLHCTRVKKHGTTTRKLDLLHCFTYIIVLCHTFTGIIILETIFNNFSLIHFNFVL